MNQEHYHKLEKMYLGVNINTMIYDTTTITIANGTAKVGMNISEKYFHALGAIHGSVYFKVLDDAAFFAVNSIVEDVFVLTASFTVKLLRPASEGLLEAVGVVTSKSQTSFEAESVLYNQEGKKIAIGTGTFVKSKTQLSPDIGYK